MHKLYILKIGGSVATEKSQKTPRIRRALLQKIFKDISQVLKENPGLQLIIVHGAGSFGHVLAHEYKLRDGTSAHNEGKKGALLTRLSVQTLNTKLLSIALSAGLSGVSLHPGDLFSHTNKKVVAFHTAPLTSALRENYVPILYGDMVFDSTLGMSVCSGDIIIAECVRRFPIEKVFFASDVDGIYTADPHTDTRATLLTTTSLPELAKVTLGGSVHTDITGGLKGKIEACKNLFASKTLKEIHVFNGLVAPHSKKALEGKKFPHTVIIKR